MIKTKVVISSKAGLDGTGRRADGQTGTAQAQARHTRDDHSHRAGGGSIAHPAGGIAARGLVQPPALRVQRAELRALRPGVPRPGVEVVGSRAAPAPAGTAA
jgi:hypothetical protein